jgi:hypothetical protein
MLTGKTRREFPATTALDQPGVPLSLVRVIESCTRNASEMRLQDMPSVREALVAVRPEGFFRKLVRISIDNLSKFEKWIASHAPPFWRKPIAWLLAGAVVFYFAWALGWILPPDPVEISIASSSTKKEWMEQAVTGFNRASRNEGNLQLSGNPFRFVGEPIEVEIILEERSPGAWDHYRSGSMILDIQTGKIKPVIASPAEHSWNKKLREEWQGDNPIASKEGTDLLATPLVIAMWESRAEALGCWPTSGPDCTWETLRSLATSPDGWGMFDHLEWGILKFGYGFVGRSNSGTFTQALLCITGLREHGLDFTIDQVRFNSPCGEAIAALEEAEIHVFDRSEGALTEMRMNGPKSLDAATTYEQEVIELNRKFGPALDERVVAIYPRDGTIVPTHPFLILNGAPWVTPEQAKAAGVFLDFLLSDQQQSLLDIHGLRPADPDTLLGPTIGPVNGGDPNADPKVVEVADTEIMIAVVELWECIRQGDCPK